MSHFVESCPAPEPVLPPQTDDPAAKRRGAKSSKVILEILTLEQRVMSAAMPSEVKRFLFAPNTDKIADNEQEMDESASKDVGKKRKLGDMESDTAVPEEDEFMWRANFEELVRRLRHKACIDTAKVRLDDEAATVLSAMIEGSRTEEKKVKTAISEPLSLNSIYEEVVKNEKNHNMTFDHVRTCLHQLRSSPAFVKGDDEYSIDYTQIIEAAQSEEVESLILRRYGRDAYKMFRLLSRAGCLMETDKIADTVFAEKKEATKALYKMWQDGYLNMEKLVVGPASALSGSAYLLWKVNKKKLLQTVLDEMFHAALNLNLRAKHELDLNKEVLNLPAEKREGPDKVKFEKLRNARLLIHSSLMKIDDAIMLFHDF
ncbi:DNA-directed RNA polymerase III subunit RPC3 [Linum grandiflorum]